MQIVIESSKFTAMQNRIKELEDQVLSLKAQAASPTLPQEIIDAFRGEREDCESKGNEVNIGIGGTRIRIMSLPSWNSAIADAIRKLIDLANPRKV